MSNTRNGRSLRSDINRISKKTLTSCLEFTEEQADRMMKARKVLPIVEDRQKPQIDARKLWEKIGKPHGRFRDFAEDYIKPELRGSKGAGKSAAFDNEIETFHEIVGKTRQVRTNYLLSRDLAANLAMMARTTEGQEVRLYFLDMEDCVVRLERYSPIRADHLTEIDNGVYHAAISETGSKMYAQETERFLKGMVAEAISGLSANEWREALNGVPGAKGKGIRDVLDGDDLKVYRDALQFAASLIQSGENDREKIETMVCAVHGNKVDPDNYLSEVLKQVA